VIAFGLLAVVAGLALVLMGNAGGWAAVGIGGVAIAVVVLLPLVFGGHSRR
jgi:hypothetical protein